MILAERDNLNRKLKEWFYYENITLNVNLFVNLLICSVMLQIAVLGADSPVLGVTRCLQGERIRQLNGAHGLGIFGIFKLKVSQMRKTYYNTPLTEFVCALREELSVVSEGEDAGLAEARVDPT